MPGTGCRTVRGALAVGVLVLLAGCSGPSGPQAAAPAVLTDPLDYSDLTNATPGGHVHDYWQGRTEVTVIDADNIPSCAYYSTQEAPQVSFQPAEGIVVPQGTGELTLTLTWVESGGADGVPPNQVTGESVYTGVEIWVKTAQDAYPRFFSPVQYGVPVTFNSTNDLDDPPHYRLSLWEFQPMVVNDVEPGTSFCGHFHLVAVAHRTLPLEVQPPHPDPWLGRTQIDIVNVTRSTAIALHSSGLGGTDLCLGSCADERFHPGAGVVVPFNTSRIEVALTLSTSSGPGSLIVRAHGADTRVFVDMLLRERSGMTWTYELAVEAGVGDSPYASQSLWEFQVRLDTPNAVGPWTGEYHVAATAFR